jgi:hypothetical protein
MHLEPRVLSRGLYSYGRRAKMYYKTEKECEKISSKKRKEIKDIALQYKMMVTEVYSTCIKEGNNS